MALIVQKYGGSSVATIDRIRNVAQRIHNLATEGNQIIAVISAMSGVTDKLIKMAHDISAAPSERELDALMATGELQSITLLSMALHELGDKAVSVSGSQAGIKTFGSHTRARIHSINADRVKQYLNDGNIVICAGFQGVCQNGHVQTLGRGGSDLSAIAMAAAVNADICQILTDVDGVYTCDPRIVKNAVKLKEITYDEMLEMASSGSKVMQSRSVEFAKKFGVIFEVKSSLNNNPGTIVQEEHPAMESVTVRGISIERNQSRVTIANIPSQLGYTAKILGALADAEINIDMILANVAQDGHARQSFTMHANDLGRAQAALKPVLTELGPNVKIETEAGLAKLSLVGIGMRSHSGVGAKAFKALADAGIPIGMISTSEIKIAVMIDEEKIDQAAKVVHDAFNLGSKP